MPLLIAIVALVYTLATSNGAAGNVLVFNTLTNIVNLSHGIWNLALPIIAVVVVLGIIVWIAKGRELGLLTSGCGCQIIAVVVFFALGAWIAGLLGHVMLSAFSPELGIVDNTKFIIGLVAYALFCWS